MAPPRKAKVGRALPGAFEPDVPRDNHGVLLLIAVAARAVCAAPQQLAAIEPRLAAVLGTLIAPEALTARECIDPWRRFAATVRSLLGTAPQQPLPAPAQRSLRTAATALASALEDIGRRLEVPPLPEWDELPEGLLAERAPAAAAARSGSSLQELRAQLRRHSDDRPTPAALLALLGRMSPAARDAAFAQAVDAGILARSDAELLGRSVARGQMPQVDDEALLDSLAALAQWLAE